MIVRPEPTTTLSRLPWRVPAQATGRAAAGTAATLLRVAEATVLASTAHLRSVLDLTRPARTAPAGPVGVPEVPADAPQVADEPPIEDLADPPEALADPAEEPMAPAEDLVEAAEERVEAAEDLVEAAEEPVEAAEDLVEAAEEPVAPSEESVAAAEAPPVPEPALVEDTPDGPPEEGPDPDAPLVPHWDELNLARIRGRLPRLSLADVRSLLAYEQAHAGRAPVVSMLENRVRKLESESEGQDFALPAE